MVAEAAASLALNVSSLVMLALAFWQLVAEPETRREHERLLVAALLHGGALVCKVASEVPVLDGDEPHVLLRYFALVLGACSAMALAVCVLADADGRMRLRDRATPLSPALVGWSVGPLAIASAITPRLGGVDILGMSYAVSLCMVCLLLQREYERELAHRESEVENAQSKVLAEQMSPHFLFNTLTSITSLCYTDPDAAASAIADLSGYLRGNINALSSDEPIPFETELSHIRQYVALEQADSARVFSMEYDLEAGSFSIPPLTIQPLVENAVKHGALARDDGLGWVRLSTEDRGRFVRVVVEDSGAGADGGRVTGEYGKAHDGVGLRSVERRLQSYGGSLRVEFGEDGGRACVLVPREEELRRHAHFDR